MGKHAVEPQVIPPAPQGYRSWDDMKLMNALKSKLGSPGPVQI